MTQPNLENQLWSAPNAADIVAVNLLPNSHDRIRDEGKASRKVLVGGAAALAGVLLIANCSGDDVEQVAADVTESDEYKSLKTGFDEAKEELKELAADNDELSTRYEETTADYNELSSKYKETSEELSELDARIEELTAMLNEDSTETEADAGVALDEDTDSDIEEVADTNEVENAGLTVSEQIRQKIDSMSEAELEEMYGMIDNPEWSENAREVGLMEEVTYENMINMLRHDRDVLGQTTGCFAYAEYTNSQVGNLGEICAGRDMAQSVEDVMNAEVQRLLNADLKEVAFTAEMAIAKLTGGNVTANSEGFYELSEYTGHYNTTRLENREDTIEGSSNYREGDTWITFGNVTLANGKTYKISFRACGQIVLPTGSPETPPTTPPGTPPETPPTTPPGTPPTTPPETPPKEPPVENPDHKSRGDAPKVAEIPAQPVDGTDGYVPGSAEENEASQDVISDGDPAPNNGEPTENGTQIEGTEGTGAQGPTVGENGDGVTDSPDEETADENDNYDGSTENSEGMDGGNADPVDTTNQDGEVVRNDENSGDPNPGEVDPVTGEIINPGGF